MKLKNSKVIVLMSVYNCEKYLREAIDSILNQTFKDFEFIIINDGSTDRTAQILESYHDPRIKVINNQKNIGLTKSLNIGIKRTRGEYIARQDADDISLPERMEKMVGFLDENRKVGVLRSSFIIIDENGNELETTILEREDEKIRKKLLRDNPFGFELFRKSAILKIGGYREEFKYAQDYDLCLRIADISKVANIEEPLYKYRICSSAISVSKFHTQRSYAELAKKLTKNRKRWGADFLQTHSKEDIKQIISKIESDSNHMPFKFIGYHKWGRYYYLRRDYKRALIFLNTFFPSNLLYKDTAFLIFKSIIKFIIPKKLYIYIRKLRINKSQK